ncbi:hypothetical protein MSAN_01887000 [Mycena sanguinolenta]|uniref:Uncharacterized protein n=1 Tax=Mycena sanguinolenta TaxID=230812 RepID=A0A8H7CT78_9AGAR|nr:hypothetical protein MSAN_01887000 [Mycena sanguinolenta]
MTVSSSLSYTPTRTTGRNLTLQDYDALPDATYREKIEDVVVRATNSEHVQALLAPRGPLWPMDIFSAACAALDRDPDTSAQSLYFSAVSAVLCSAIGSLRSPSSTPPPPPMAPTQAERREMQKRVVASVHRCPAHPLRVQVLRHMHLKWTLAMNAARSGSGYASDETEESVSDEDELELVLTRRE